MVSFIRNRRLELVALCVAVVGSCMVAEQQPAGDGGLAPLQVVDVSFMDTTVSACTDFFEYAAGTWLRTDTIPAAYASSGVLRDMTDRNELVVKSVLEDAVARVASLPDTSTQHKLGTFYGSCMDSVGIEAAGLAPLTATFAEIDAIDGKTALLAAIAHLQRMNGTRLLFRYYPSVDAHDAEHYIADIDRSGLGLPDRDYYLNDAPSADSTRRAYIAHIGAMLTLAGEDSTTAAADAKRVMSVETELARAQLPRVERRDPKNSDHPMTVAELQKLTPNVQWASYFRDIGLTSPVARVNVDEPAFMRAVDKLIASRPMEDWHAYLRYSVLAGTAPWLSSAFVNESFEFGKRFSGAEELLPRWKRCLAATDGQMGEALGQAYVARTFPPEAKAKAKSVIDDIRAAFKERLLGLTWMSDSTRAQALDKLAQMGEKVGYPDTWRDYSALEVTDQPFVLNVAAARRFEWNRIVDRPGRAVDKTEWDITVPTVNAYYDPTKNEMVFPAGALVPQTFDPNADDGANYGSLGGSWAGHELTHGFDDEGRHYDAEGNLRDWWTDADSKAFNVQAELDASQYDGYIQVDTFHVNGHMTLGENIADYGGALTGYDALERALARNGRPGLIDGFTPEQRFFIAFAQSYRSHTRPESLVARVKVDPHSPERWRVNGPLSNMAAFATAFGCKVGDPMVRADPLVPRIW